jgi:hypothetical protein
LQGKQVKEKKKKVSVEEKMGLTAFLRRPPIYLLFYGYATSRRDVTPSSEVVGAGRYYTVAIADSDGGEWTFLIEKSSSTQTLLEALVVDPDELGLAAGLGNLVDVDVTAPSDRDVLGWDADLQQWVPIEVVGLTRPEVAGILRHFGHSMGKIAPGLRSATLSGAHAAGDDVLTVATANTLAPGRWMIREAADQNSEFVTIPADWDCSGTVVKIATPLVRSHATSTTVVDPAPLCGERMGRMLAAKYENRAISGATLCKAGAPGTADYGGFNRPLREIPVPASIKGANQDPPPGVLFEFIGLNDDGDANLTAAGATAINNAYRHAMRSILAVASLGCRYEAETPFPNLTFGVQPGGSGTWTTNTTTAGNSGTGTLSNPSAGATLTWTIPADFGGPAGSPVRMVDWFFVANYVGGSTITTPCSQLTFTLNGTTVYPTGGNESGPYSATNPFTTADQNPAVFGTVLPAVARIPVSRCHTPTSSPGPWRSPHGAPWRAPPSTQMASPPCTRRAARCCPESTICSTRTMAP